MTMWPKAFTHADVPLRVKVRFLRHALPQMGDPDACWGWPKSKASHGYGQIGWQDDGERGLVLSHRLSWLLFHGEIPEGMTVDHVCRNRMCWNPAHLRLLTNVENAADNGFAAKTHCPQGHEYTELNTYLQPSTGHRKCRRCAHERKVAS